MVYFLLYDELGELEPDELPDVLPDDPDDAPDPLPEDADGTTAVW